MDMFSRAKRSEVMSRIRSKHTAPEVIVRKIVHRMGFRYRLHVRHLPGKPDLVFRRMKKIIEVRGCFWHQHVGCVDSHLPKSRTDYWTPKLNRNVERDKTNNKELKKLGWQVLIVWDCELREARTVTRRLLKFLKD
jgi:DNA mismatch endonuclease (patch repair protein)